MHRVLHYGLHNENALGLALIMRNAFLVQLKITARSRKIPKCPKLGSRKNYAFSGICFFRVSLYSKHFSNKPQWYFICFLTCTLIFHSWLDSFLHFQLCSASDSLTYPHVIQGKMVAIYLSKDNFIIILRNAQFHFHTLIQECKSQILF